jgi:hypothetical protein
MVGMASGLRLCEFNKGVLVVHFLTSTLRRDLVPCRVEDEVGIDTRGLGWWSWLATLRWVARALADQFTYSSGDLLVASETTYELCRSWCAILGLNQSTNRRGSLSMLSKVLDADTRWCLYAAKCAAGQYNSGNDPLTGTYGELYGPGSETTAGHARP